VLAGDISTAATPETWPPVPPTRARDGLPHRCRSPETWSPALPPCPGATARSGPSRPRSSPTIACHPRPPAPSALQPQPRRLTHAIASTSPAAIVPAVSLHGETSAPREASPPSSVARLRQLRPPTEARGGRSGREEGGRREDLVFVGGEGRGGHKYLT
jgi:hypothetical protein